MMLPLIMFLIIVGAISIAAIALSDQKTARWISILFTAIFLAVALTAILYALSGNPISESYAYIKYLNVYLAFTASGVSAVLLLMAGIVLLAAAASGNPENEDIRLSSAMIVLFGIASAGLFASANLFMFFIFWDIGVISLFIMINVLGSENRRSASINFLVYEIFASSLLLIGILLLYVYSPTHSLNMSTLATAVHSMPGNIRDIIFFVMFLAFMTNMPLFPMHYWLPDAHTEASTQGSMLLSGILTKFGGFGMIILFTIIPLSSSHSLYIAALATLSAIYGALIMIRQTDLKRVIAYSTIVEMGVIMVAISAGNALGTSGAIYGMLSHGLIVAFMFLAVGFIKHTFKERNITRLRGILSNAKTTAYMFMLGALAMVGLPLTSGFVAEVLIFLGAAQAFGLYGLLPLIPIIIMGAFMYGIVSKIILSSNEPSERFDYVSADQKIGYYIIAASIVAVGILPFFILNLLKL